MNEPGRHSADGVAVTQPDISTRQPGHVVAGSTSGSTSGSTAGSTAGSIGVGTGVADDVSLEPVGGARPAPKPRHPAPGRPAGPRVCLSELIVLALILLIAEVAWVGLALAHLGAHRLWLVLLVSCVLAALTAAVLLRSGRPRVRTDAGGLIMIAALGCLSVFLFVPGFHYGAGDKDPGVYVEHAMSIARTGSYSLVDPTVGRVASVEQASVGAPLPGIWQSSSDPSVVVPQFYHLWPALLATAYEIGGEKGLAEVGPLCGVLAVMAAALALRRAVRFAPWGNERAALVGGSAAGLLLATNMLEVWQAKYPSAEISAQMLWTGALLALVVTLTARWRFAAGVAGVLVGVGFLNRGDGLLPVLLTCGLGAALLALRKWDARACWMAGGLLIVLPHALWQAYSPSAARAYSLGNGLPSLPKLLAGLVVLFGVALALRFSRIGPAIGTVMLRRRVQIGVGAAVVVVVVGLLCLGWRRAEIFGVAFMDVNGTQVRSYDEITLQRLGWFLMSPVLLLATAGLAVVALRRWSAVLWALVVPTLLIFPVYVVHAKNSPWLMWWPRRFVPLVTPGLFLLVGVLVAAAWVLLGRYRWRTARWGVRCLAVGAVGWLVVIYLGQSLPLRAHDETAGSFALSARLAALAPPGRGVFLVQRSPCCGHVDQISAGPLWLARGQVSALLPQSAAGQPDYIKSFQRGFPGYQVFVIYNGQARPPLPGLALSAVDRVNLAIPMWAETVLSRPRNAVDVPLDFSVWRVDNAP